MLSTEENIEMAQDIVVQVEDGEFSNVDNSQVSRKLKISCRKADKYILVANQPSIQEKLSETDVPQKTSEQTTCKYEEENFEDSANDKVDWSNKTGSNLRGGDVDLDQTERHISGKSEGYDSDKSQDNFTMTARTENDISEMPENEINVSQDQEGVDKSEKKYKQRDSNHIKDFKAKTKLDADSKDLDRYCNAGNDVNKIGEGDIETDNNVKENIFSEEIKRENINQHGKTKDSTTGTPTKGDDETPNEMVTLDMDEKMLDDYIKEAEEQTERSKSEDTTEIKEEIDCASIQTEIFDGLLNDFIQEEEQNGEMIDQAIYSKGDENVVIH